MGTEFRTDALATLRDPVEHPGGFLLLEGYAARPGIYTYRRADGTTFRELVDEDVLHSPDTLGSLGRAPVTLEHPAGGRVDAANWEKVAVGDVDGEVAIERLGGFVRVKLAVRRKDAIEDVQHRRRRELSCGYLVDVDPTPGTWQGQRYDQRQTRRIYNHLAIVQAGRHGPDCSLRVDSMPSAVCCDGPRPEHDPHPAPSGGAPMAKVRIDNAEYEVADAATAQVFAKAVQERDEARQRADAEAAKLSTITGERDELKGKVTALEAKLDSLKDAIPADQLQARIDARVELVGQAQRAGVESPSTKTDGELKRAIVAQAFPKVSLDGVSDGELAGMFRVAVDALPASAAASPPAPSALGEAFGRPPGRGDSDAPRSLSARYLDSIRPAQS